MWVGTQIAKQSNEPLKVYILWYDYLNPKHRLNDKIYPELTCNASPLQATIFSQQTFDVPGKVKGQSMLCKRHALNVTSPYNTNYVSTSANVLGGLLCVSMNFKLDGNI